MAGSPLAEIFLDRRDDNIKIVWPPRSPPRSKLRTLLEPYFSADGTLLRDPITALPVLCRKIAQAPKTIRDKIRLSQQIEPWLVRQIQHVGRDKARQLFDMDVTQGKRTEDVVNVPLYPYQQQGMRHLAFTERAIGR